MRVLICLILSFCTVLSVSAADFVIRGKVTDKENATPIEPAVITIPEYQLWAVTNEKGEFVIKGVPEGTHFLIASCLGYRKEELKIQVPSIDESLEIRMLSDNLALSEVVVTARENKHSTAISYLIDKGALDHHQMMSVTGLTTLLPGGKTATDNNLATADKRFEIRSASTEMGNPTFMTAVEVDGIRLSNNASFTETAGADVRNIPTANIESVEVITGIPSVEYGDVSGGVVKINTQKGRIPFNATLQAGPRTKSISIGKGLDLKNNRGILNMGLERTVSVSELASPFTRYSRNGLNIKYSNTLGRSSGMPLALNATFAGNIGGYDSEADPDAFAETYTKQKDQTFRGSVGFDWLLNKPFLTGIEGKVSVRYSNKLEKVNTNKSSSTSTAVFHGSEEGYFVATDFQTDPDAAVSLIPAGYWYQLKYRDDRPVEYNAALKFYHNLNLGVWSNKLKVGMDFSSQGNLGKGIYYDDPRYTPDWRAYPYSEIPFMNNLALYAEDGMQFPIASTYLQVTAGLRYDMSRIDGSTYGTVSALSPRVNAIYTIIERPAAPLLRSLKIRGGIGDAVKLPSFAILYPEPTYKQIQTFSPGALADGTAYYAYYLLPAERLYNPDLKWQSTRQSEIGIDMKLGQFSVSVNAYRNKSRNGYMNLTTYTPFSYKYTDQKSIEGTAIPIENRIYSVDRQTGIVTMADRTGAYPSVVLPYAERTTFTGQSYAANSSPVIREGIEWIADFGKIPVIYTSFRFDGNYYHYRGVNETMIASTPVSSQNMASGLPYKYIGFYAGTNMSTASPKVANGSETHRVNANLTATTHIPRIRLLISLRLESTLYHSSQNLSEFNGKARGIVIESRDEYTGTSSDIYGGDRYVAVYPEYYVSADDMNTRIPFEEAFLDAKANNPELYNELAKLVLKSNTSYYFNQDRLSPYFSVNLSVTKEIGKHFSLSFYANNFLNNLSKVTSSANNTESSLYNSTRIPYFDYGIMLKIKL